MIDQPHGDSASSTAAKGQVKETQLSPAPAKPPADIAGAPVFPADESASAKNLSAEEQLALYEKDLKENDWGHQPC